MPCEATPRRQYYKTNWTCDGTDLVRIMDALDGIPCVAPRARLGELMSAPWAEAYHPMPFTGGDHCHAVLDPKE